MKNRSFLVAICILFTTKSVYSQLTANDQFSFAIKSNLLFDALLTPNIEVEVPFNQNWSIALEYTFPWWTQDNGFSNSKRNRYHIQYWSLEGRYWFNKTDNILNGWFTSLNGGGGSYDIERHRTGYQGDYVFSIGGGGGYTHALNKSKTLRMEYEFGLGYVQTKYHKYESHYHCDLKQWHPLITREKTSSMILPTKLKVSLVWIINISR